MAQRWRPGGTPVWCLGGLLLLFHLGSLTAEEEVRSVIELESPGGESLPRQEMERKLHTRVPGTGARRDLGETWGVVKDIVNVGKKVVKKVVEKVKEHHKKPAEKEAPAKIEGGNTDADPAPCTSRPGWADALGDRCGNYQYCDDDSYMPTTGPHKYIKARDACCE